MGGNRKINQTHQAGGAVRHPLVPVRKTFKTRLYENVSSLTLHKTQPIVAMSNGAGNLGSASIIELVKYFRAQFMRDSSDLGLEESNYTIEQITHSAADYLGQYVQSNESFEFFVGGYGSTASLGEIWKFTFTDGGRTEPTLMVPQEIDAQILWGGSGEYSLHRLILGRDMNIPQYLADAGVENAVIEEMEQQVVTPIVDPAMPVQDAIDLADYLVKVAKGFSAFSPGMNVVGGETDIAVVTRHEGFKWVRRKHFYDRRLNNQETDHE